MSSETVRARVEEATGSRTPVRITAKSGWMSAGRPSPATQSLSVADDNGIVDYVADDLTITVRAGTTFEQIKSATRANNQWLPLDPFGGDAGTIGATIATGSSGPLSHGYGPARDFILGIEFVTGRGDIVRAGGRVVKNVAGFDLMRLLCGSWGTLGVITELTLRLYAVPKKERTLALMVPPGKLAELTGLLRKASVAPIAMELVSSRAAQRIGLAEADTILLRIAGNEAVVDSQTRTIGEIGRVAEASPDGWENLRRLDGDAKISLRVSGLPTDVPTIWEAGNSALTKHRDAWMHSTFSRGIVRMVSCESENSEAQDAVRTFGSAGRPVFESLPVNMWAQLSPGVTLNRLSQGVKRAYDPLNILNPGLLGD